MAHLQKRRYAAAAKALTGAIAKSPAPRENWYQSLLGAHYELKDYRQCVRLLHTMVRRYLGRDSHWRQLSGLLGLLQDYKDALSVMELATLGGYLDKEEDLLSLAQLYLHQGIPYKAGKVLEDGLRRGAIRPEWRHLDLAATAWMQARETEKALALLQGAWPSDPHGKLSMRLAETHITLRQWRHASTVLRRLLAARDLPPPTRGRAWLMLGMAHHEEGREKDALRAFQQAAGYDDVRQEAQQWTAFLMPTPPTPAAPATAPGEEPAPHPSHGRQDRGEAGRAEGAPAQAARGDLPPTLP